MIHVLAEVAKNTKSAVEDRWHLERMKQNQDVFGFEIGEEDMYRLGTMAQTGWSGLHPDGGSTRGASK